MHMHLHLYFKRIFEDHLITFGVAKSKTPFQY